VTEPTVSQGPCPVCGADWHIHCSKGCANCDDPKSPVPRYASTFCERAANRSACDVSRSIPVPTEPTVTQPIVGRTERRIRGANSRSAALPPKDSDQCCEVLTIPMYSRTSPSVSLAVCVLKVGHEGKHKTSETYGSKEWA
jgi:hypothetical protein